MSRDTIRVMNGPVTQQAPLRDRQKDETRDRIRAAVLDLLETEMPATIPVPAVAERAGVSLRTVYRYFPTTTDLIQSSTDRQDERARALSQADPIRADGIEPYLTALWEDFATNVAGVRVLHQGPLPREARLRRLAEIRAGLLRATSERLAHLDEADHADVVDVVIAVTSSSMFLELVDRMGHDPAHAARLASHVSSVLLQDADSKKEPS